MFDSKSIETLVQKLIKSLPSSVQQCEKEVHQQFKAIIQAAFARMDLVTRDEFDVQAKVLARTREKVDALQAKLDKITQQSTD